MEELEAEVHLDFSLAGTQVDLLAKSGDRCLAIDLVGYPGSFSRAFPFHHYQLMARLGLPTIIIYYSDWYLRPEYVQEEIKFQWNHLHPT